jgi:hypothetical protein
MLCTVVVVVWCWRSVTAAATAELLSLHALHCCYYCCGCRQYSDSTAAAAVLQLVVQMDSVSTSTHSAKRAPKLSVHCEDEKTSNSLVHKVHKSKPHHSLKNPDYLYTPLCSIDALPLTAAENVNSVL